MLAAEHLVTRRWRGILVMALCFALIPAGVALADHTAPFDGTMHDYGEMVQYDLVFPVVGDYTLRDTFFAARTNGDHHAQDIMSDKMTPIVAAASGTIRYINWTRDAEAMWTNGRCCTMVITHDDGWETWYIHMNNDTPGTDDGLGWGIAPGLVPGMHVDADQLIGWVGDSGNAESTNPHLHFELYDPERVIVNPYEALLAAADPTCDVDCAPFTTLALGSQGPAVVELQTMLDVLGHDPGPIDGIFGNLTRSAVQSFESAEGLTVDGVVDEPTWDAIVAAYQAPQLSVVRQYGVDRFATAAAIAGASHPNGADVVFVAVGTNYPDALSAGPAAARLGAPIVLVRQDALPGSTAAALESLDPTTVFVLGGPVAVTDTVVDAIEVVVPGASVSRLFGPDRYSTAVAVSQQAFPTGAGTVYVVTGLGFPDATTAAPAAITEDAPVLLVATDEIPSVVADELTRLGPNRIVIVGGTAAVTPAVETALGAFAPTVDRIAGVDRYSGSVAVSAATFPSGASTVYIAVGTVFADALAGGPSVVGSPGPILLVDPGSIPAVVEAEIRRLDPTRIVVFGGPAAVSDEMLALLGEIPGSTPPPDPAGGPPQITYDPQQDSEQWRPLLEYVFAMWGLDQEKCGTGDRANDCIGDQVDNALIIMECESFGDPTIVNPSSGTTGLFQHRPIYWPDRVARVRNHFSEFPSDATPYEPYDNVMVAALLVDESRDALIGENSLTGPWDDGPEPWGHWNGSARYCADPPLVWP